MASSARMTIGDRVAARSLTAVSGEEVRVPATSRLTHLQFRRFAGCPVCDLHLREVARRHAEIASAGVREVVLFHSSAKALAPYVADLPFPVVPDPEKRLYRAFGVEAAPRALTTPAVWPVIARSVGRALVWTLEGRPPPPFRAEGGRLGLPADILIDAAGQVVACRYGEHAYDQWSVDELLALARPT
jgi:peroxiredoxin